MVTCAFGALLMAVQYGFLHLGPPGQTCLNPAAVVYGMETPRLATGSEAGGAGPGEAGPTGRQRKLGT